MCRFRFWGQNKNIQLQLLCLTLSPPREISRIAVNQLALPYYNVMQVSYVTAFSFAGMEQSLDLGTLLTEAESNGKTLASLKLQGR
jgi:hypothetical protein